MPWKGSGLPRFCRDNCWYSWTQKYDMADCCFLLKVDSHEPLSILHGSGCAQHTHMLEKAAWPYIVGFVPTLSSRREAQ